MKKEYEILFTPAKIGNLEIQNRFIVPPMSFTDVIGWSNYGKSESKIEDFVLNKARDGVGCFIFGALTIFNKDDPDVWLYQRPELFNHVPALMDKLHSYGTKAIQQLGFSAGKALSLPPALMNNYGKDPVVTHNADICMLSADAGLPNRWKPEWKTKQMSRERIHDIIHGMAEAAYLCKQSGIDGVEVHGSHEGYALDQFITPYTNHRTDEYGGSLENRLRFEVEIIKAIKERCGSDYPVVVRYSIESKTRDFGHGIIPADHTSKEIGKTLEESQKAIQILTGAGVDAFDCDNGTYDAWYYPHPPVYMPLNTNLKEATEVKPFTSKPIICSGRMQPDAAAEAISAGKLDFVGVGRQNLAESEYITKLREGREEDIRPCISCHLGCLPIGSWKGAPCSFGQLGNCALNPYAGHEAKYDAMPKPTKSKNIAVIGAGIAGMEFALRATERGHKVTVFEKGQRTGGLFNEAAAFSYKEKDQDLLAYYARNVKKANIDIRFGVEIKSLDELSEYDDIVVATGSLAARRLNLPGSERFITASDFLHEGQPAGDKVVVIGGGITGCEIAYEMALKGKQVQIVEVMDDILIAPGTSAANTSFLRDAFEYYKVPVYTSAKVVSDDGKAVTIVKDDGTEARLEADTVVQAVGFIQGLPFDIEGRDNVHVIGDASKISNLLNAVHNAYDLAMSM